ncbi:MAG: flagellar hook-associated protein FlgK [Thermoanaerobacteraceae bacterium]|nr:flagellar hook-associated protein FlgK [Thermoanaerobacteraceae bacterium]
MSGGTFFGINTALRGLMVHQRALQTTSHNVANASTEGYTRQRVVMVPTLAYPVPAMNRPGGQGWQVGTGVDVQEIRRIRDEFLDTQVRRETGTLGRWEQIQYILEQVEIVFNEPSDTGLNTLLSQFWSSWQELAKNAESSPVRMTVIETAAALAEAFNHSARQLDNIKADIENALQLKIQEVELLCKQIAELNVQIRSIITAGDQPNDLLDRRDLLLDQLSKILDFTVERNTDGTINIKVGGTSLVEVDKVNLPDTSESTVELVVNDAQATLTITAAGEPTPFTITIKGGEILGLGEAYNLVNEYRRDLDTLAAELAGAINALHEAGYGIENPPQSRSFFVPETGIDAGNISVNGELRSNPMLIAAATTVNVDIPETLGYDAVGKGLVLDASYQIVVSDSGLQLQKSTDGGTTWTDVGGVVTSITWDGATPVTVGDSNESITFTTSTSSPPRGNYEVTLVTASPGDGSNALKIAQLQHEPRQIGNLNTTFDDYYKNFTARLGVEGHEAGRMVVNQQALVDQLAGRRESISGVALDEEMTYMIQFQRGYEAAARVMTVLDELLDTLINRMAAH